MDGLAAASRINVDIDIDSDDDSRIVSASLTVEQSPGLISGPPSARHRSRQKNHGQKSHRHRKLLPTKLKAADPFLNLPALLSWTREQRQPDETEAMVTSDIEAQALGIPHCGWRRRRSRIFPERLPGQKTTSNLHRTSPTSLLPLREKKSRHSLRYSSRFGKTTAGPCQIGQALLETLHVSKMAQVRRRDLMLQYNERVEHGAWRDKVGHWDMYDWVVASLHPWWLNMAQPEEEIEVEGLLPAAAVDCDVDFNAVDAFQLDCSAFRIEVASRKRHTLNDSGYGDEASVRWARRNELRMLEEIRPHIDRLRARSMSRSQAIVRARRERAEAAHRRIEAERWRREEEERHEAERELILIAHGTPPLEPILTDLAAPSSRESSGSSSPSEPPQYEFPFYPIVIPRPAHLRERRNMSSTSAVFSPPGYVRNLRYRSISPSPPPPYNASTDRETLVEPMFIEDDPEEEAMLARIRPSGLFRSPSRNQAVVGAFPESQEIAVERRVVGPTQGRSAWDAALELEEGEEDSAERAFEEDDRDVTEQVTVLGPIGRLLGRVWRW